MKRIKTLALVAHDNMKRDLAEWVDWNFAKLRTHRLICTGTTGKMVEKTLLGHADDTADGESRSELEIVKLKSGPLGGDQQLGSLIANEQILLGPDVGTAARRGCQGPIETCHTLQCPDGNRPFDGRLHNIIPALRF